MNQLAIYTGGMSKCCINTIRDYAGPTPEGTELKCRTCRASLLVRRAAWETMHPAPVPAAVYNARVDG